MAVLTTEFYIPHNGIRLHAKLDMPRGASDGGKCPLMLLIHGLTGDMEEAHLVAVKDKMNELGCAVLRVELYGHGGSDGEFRDHTLYSWNEDALAALNYVKTLDFVTDLIICGHSQGGLTAMYAAAIRREDVKAMVLLAPAWNIPDEVRAGTLYDVPCDPERMPEEISCWGGEFVMGRDYLRVARMMHPEAAIPEFHGPVLIIQGTDDDPMIIEYARRAADMYDNAEYVEIEGDTHCYDYHPEIMTAAVERFVRRVL